MQIRQTSNRNLLLSGLVIASLITLTMMHNNISTELYESEQRRSISLKVANQIHLTSIELAREMSFYAATLGPIHLKSYKKLRALQQGMLAALLKSGEDKDVQSTDGVEINAHTELIEKGNISAEEQTKLLESQNLLRGLMKLEAVALNTVAGGGQPKVKQLLNSKKYSSASDAFSRSIEDFVTIVNRRTDSKAEEFELKKTKLFKNYGFLLFIILAATVFEYFWGTKKIVAPIEELTKIAGIMVEGDYKQRVDIKADNEIGVLASTFNEMAESIEQDIAERRRTTDELQVLRQDAETANSAKSDFLATMSHEIRTPMNAIIGMSHLALQTNLNAKQHDYVIKIFDAANSLLGIINDILDFSKLEAGKAEMEKIAFRLDEVLENLSNVISIKAQEKDLEFLISIGSDVPLGLVGDSLKLGQVLINLANNAVKFTESGEIIIRVEKLDGNDEQATLKFSLQDSGIGMTAEQQGRLFQAFSQADTSTTRKYGGTGLGLTISKRLVELMEGEIWVESEYEVGSTFLFTAKFPIHDSDHEYSRTLPDVLINHRVLVVDDGPDSRMILHEMIEALGLTCEEVKSGREAVERLIGAAKNNQPFNLVFMDWRMPEMDGIETIRELQANNSIYPQPKVIMVTAYGRQEIFDQAGEMGLSGILLKPVTPSILFDSIMGAFGHATEPNKKHRIHLTDHALEATQLIRGARILLVEDNEINQQVATELLEQAQLVITVANNGVEAIEALEAEEFDGVLMDLQMPVMGGLEATRRLRAMDKFKDMPIIAMTANVMGGDREKCLKAGMNDFVGKPIDPKILFATLIQWIEHAEREVPEELIKRLDGSVEDNNDQPDLPGFDVYAALDRVGGSIKTFRKLLARFVESEADAVERIRAAQAAGDHEATIRAAHTLKGVAGNIGAIAVQTSAAEVEAFLNENDGAIPETLMSKTEETLRSALESVEKDIAAPSQQILKGPASNSDCQLLLDQLADQIDEFDSTASETGETLKSQSAGTAWAVEAKELASALNDYDYDQAEELLAKIKEIQRSETALQQRDAIVSAELIEELETLALRIEDQDAMTEDLFEGVLDKSTWLKSQSSVASLKRSLLGYDFATASLQLHDIVLAARENMEMDDEA
jgi:signal transduction histidine kinase/CheY-like chemotaxis protein